MRKSLQIAMMKRCQILSESAKDVMWQKRGSSYNCYLKKKASYEWDDYYWGENQQTKQGLHFELFSKLCVSRECHSRVVPFVLVAVFSHQQCCLYLFILHGQFEVLHDVFVDSSYRPFTRQWVWRWVVQRGSIFAFTLGVSKIVRYIAYTRCNPQ